jgi:tetratricopeptide (TPR) repeat protein
VTGRRRPALFFLALSLVAVCAGIASVVRIGPNEVGLSSAGVVEPGLRFALPWSKPVRVARRGTVTLDEIPLRTREGSTLRFQVTGDYEIGDVVESSLARQIRAEGLARALGARATASFARAAESRGVESLLADRTILESAFASELMPAGIGFTRLMARSTIEDEVLRRRRTEDARGLRRPRPGRLLLIGLDGADWSSIRPLVAEGRMPQVARLLRDSAWGPLRSYDPMYSPLIWTTIATGKSPDKHGIADFLVKDEHLGTRRPITSDFRKVKALWNILSDFDVPSGWVGWWATYPAEPIRGVLVSEMVAHAVVRSGAEAASERERLTSPPEYLRERSAMLVPPAKIDRSDVLRLFPVDEAAFRAARARAPTDEPERDSKAPTDPLIHAIKLLCAMRTYHHLALDLLRQGLPVVAVYYEGIDMMGHRFQHYLPPKMALATDEEFTRFRHAVTGYYEIQDEMIGELLAAAGPDTTTVIVSDHGFATGSDRPTGVAPYTTGQPAEWHRPWGIWIVHGPGVNPGPGGPASVYDVAPTVLELVGLPPAQDMQGRILPAFGPDGGAQTSIPSYELVGAPLDHGEPFTIDAEAASEMLANLKALGYVGGVESIGAAHAGSESAPASTQVYYHRNLATYHIKQGEYGDAERELLVANERQPLPKTYSMLSEVRAAQNRFSEAAVALEDGWSKIPEQMDPHTILWIVELHLRGADRAAAQHAVTRHATRITPPVQAAIDARFREADGDADGAITLYERALTDDPLLTHALLRLLALRRSRGEPQRVEPFLRAGLEREERSDLYHNLLGETLRERGELQPALTQFRRANELVPDDPTYLANVAATAAALGLDAEALAAIEWARRIDPHDAQVWLGLGSALDRLGRGADALAALDRAAALAPDDPRPLLASAVVLARTGRVAEARRTVERARARFPESPAVRALAERLN